MPYLTWKKSSGDLELNEKSETQMQLTLSLGDEELRELGDALRELDTQAELRLTLSENWVIFWKLREEESRLLLAHPERESWAATLALTSPDRDRLLERLQKLEARQAVTLRETFPVGRVSNFDVVIRTR